MDNDKQLDDSWLVEQYKAGHKNALTVLVKRWHIKLCKQAFWYSKDYDAAKDIAQDGWRVIIDKIDTLKDSKRFGSWALSIVSNKSKDWLRKRTRSKTQLDVYSQEMSSDLNNQDINADEISINVMQVINELPSNQQLVLKMFYLESYTIADISKTLNVSKGTIKSRLFYAREKLKVIIKNRNYEK
ncbi:MAG: sigma-70 family RNA polymerase sigma factor [Bacteroidia bacterium]|nr:sigma-70 family RNA polymerase sigma factor [Bacteroidia bacterium]